MGRCGLHGYICAAQGPFSHHILTSKLPKLVYEAYSRNVNRPRGDLPKPAVCVFRVSGCLITKKGCNSLASALRSNPDHLQELDIRYNHLGDSGVRLLTARLEDPTCALNTLKYAETSA